MSLINDMLRNLEQRHAAGAPLPNEVRPLPADEPGRSWAPLGALLLMLLVGVGAWLIWREMLSPPVLSPVLPAVPVTVTAAPAVTLPPTTATAPTPASGSEPGGVDRMPTTEVLRLETSLRSLEVAGASAAAIGSAASRPAEATMATGKPLAVVPRAARPERPAKTEVAPVLPATLPVDKAVVAPDPALQAEADLRRARELLAQGRRDEAEPLFRQVLARLPAQTDVAMTLARLQVDRGDSNGAWDTLQGSLPHARNQASYRAFCGTVLQRLNRSREAVEHYQAALRINPAEGRWLIGLGLALESAGQTQEARDAFQRARASGNLPPEMAVFAEQKLR